MLEPHHVRLLTVAARSWDEAEARAAELVCVEGPIITMASGAKRPHPAVRIANEARATFIRAVRELDLDLRSAPRGHHPVGERRRV